MLTSPSVVTVLVSRLFPLVSLCNEYCVECRACCACLQLDSLDEQRLRYLAYTSRGCFAPLCAFLGGVAAQEALKALTGKFTPLNQWVSQQYCSTF